MNQTLNLSSLTAFIYLADMLVIGWFLLPRLLPWLWIVPEEPGLAGVVPPLPAGLIRAPAAWLLGALLLNWFNFTLCDALRSMHTGCMITLTLATIASGFILWHSWYWRTDDEDEGEAGWPWLQHKTELVWLIFALVLSGFIAWYTFRIHNGALLIGGTVWSDFGPHLALIRSFSMGDNFPPQYPHFPDGTIRYHFLFQFMVASFEHLGMPLDWAFNLPSMLSLTSVFLLLYALAVVITGRRIAGVVTGLMFIFRSSFAIFSFAGEHLDNLPQSLREVSLHIGKTEHENWGLFAQNVYANQRHFAFAIGVMLCVLLMMLPLLNTAQPASGLPVRSWREGLRSWITVEGWRPEDLPRAITVGLLLGALGFWNGAVLIATLLVLAVLALFSRHRLEFLIIAVLAVILAQLQSSWFIGTGPSVVKPEACFGFLAERKTVAGVISYLLQLLGLFVPLLLIGALGSLRGAKVLTLAFATPLVFAFGILLTVDISANHKFVMMGVMLGNIIVAAFLLQLWDTRMAALRVLAGMLFVLLTATGYVDLLTLYNMNKDPDPQQLDDPVFRWITANTKPHDVFLTDQEVLNTPLLAGRPIYFGRPYYAWSAGYNTDARNALAMRMLTTNHAAGLPALARQQGIAYILIDDNLRNSTEYKPNENLIAASFPVVFRSDVRHTFIYRVQ